MEKQMDPRAIRTRKLIIDAFNQLLVSKGFEHITVKDITELATINRATFYAHFVDKYALLEEVLMELIGTIMGECLAEIDAQEPFEPVLVQLFLGIVQVHDQMYANCRRGYNAFTHTIDEKLKEYLEDEISKRLPQQERLQAVLVSWGLYGSYVDWDKNKSGAAQEYAHIVAQKLVTTLLK